MGITWAIFSDPIITFFFKYLTSTQQDTYRSVNDFIFVILISIYLFIVIRRQQLKLSQSEEQYRALFESNPNPMWIYDIDTFKFINVNNAAVKKYGYERKQFLQMTICDIRPERDHAKVRKFANELSNGVRHSGIWEHLKANGQSIKVAIISHAVTFEN
ncbi:MAG: PAS domain S-box protein, partial [Mucilaginibacter sp.]